MSNEWRIPEIPTAPHRARFRLTRRTIVGGVIALSALVLVAKALAERRARHEIDSTAAKYSSLVDITYRDVSVSIPRFRVSLHGVNVRPLAGGDPLIIEKATLLKLSTTEGFPDHFRARLKGLQIPKGLSVLPAQSAASRFVASSDVPLTGNYEIRWDRNRSARDLSFAFSADLVDLFRVRIDLVLGNFEFAKSAESELGAALQNLARLGNTIVREASLEFYDESLVDQFMLQSGGGGNAVETAGTLLADLDNRMYTSGSARRKDLLVDYQSFLIEGGTLGVDLRPRQAVPISKIVRLLAGGNADDLWEALQPQSRHTKSNKSRSQSSDSALDRRRWITEAMVKAVAREDRAAFEKWIKAGADPNATDVYGLSALTYAAETNNVDIASILLQRGASPTKLNGDGTTALSRAHWLNDVNYPARDQIIQVFERAAGSVKASGTGTPEDTDKFEVPFDKTILVSACLGVNPWLTAETLNSYSWYKDDSNFVFSPDRKRVAFTRMLREGEYGDGPVYVLLAETHPGSMPKIIYSNCLGKMIAEPITVTDKTVVVRDHAQGQLAIIDAMTGVQKSSYSISGGANLSPNGDYLARVGGRYRQWSQNRGWWGQGVNLVLSNADGSNEAQVTSFDRYDYGQSIEWSPDGRRVIFDVGSAETQGKECRVGKYVGQPGDCFDVYEYDVTRKSVRFVGKVPRYIH